MVYKTCQFCSSEFETEDSRKKFCNRSCAASFNNAAHPKRVCQQATINCSKCGELVLLSRRKHGGYSLRSLCNRCLKISRVQALTNTTDSLIEDQTKASLYGRRKNWQSANSTLRNHSRSTFRSYGRPEYCFVCGYELHIEVSHIKAIKDFPDDTKIIDINDVSNLVALCPTHHWEYDNGVFMKQHLIWADSSVRPGDTIKITDLMRKLEPKIVGDLSTITMISSNPSGLAKGNMGPKPVFKIEIRDGSGTKYWFDSFILIKVLFEPEISV